MAYLGATQGFVDKLVEDYLAGLPMDRSIPGISAVEAEHFAGQMVGVALIEMLDPAPGDIERDDGPRVNDLVQITLARRFREAAKSAPPRERAVLEERAVRALVRAATSPVRTCAIWYQDIYDELAQSFAHRGDHDAAIDFAKRGAVYALRFEDGPSLRTRLRDLAALSLAVDGDAALRAWAAIVRDDPRDRWTYVRLDFAAEDTGLPEIARLAIQRGLEVLRGEEDEDARSVRRQFERRAREPLRAEPRCNATEAGLAEIRLALADARPGVVRTDEELTLALIPDLDAVPYKRLPTEADLIPRDHLVGRIRGAAPPTRPVVTARPSAERARSPGRWRPAEGETAPAPSSPCPCGSGKRYKKCCKPR